MQKLALLVGLTLAAASQRKLAGSRHSRHLRKKDGAEGGFEDIFDEITEAEASVSKPRRMQEVEPSEGEEEQKEKAQKK